MRLAHLYIVSTLFLFACSSQQISDYKYNYNEVESGMQQDSSFDSLISTYRIKMDAMMNEVIGSSDSTLVKYAPESPLGNFSADVIYTAGLNNASKLVGKELTKENSFCLLNFGGLRAPLNQGNITVGNIYELMPFDNRVVVVELEVEQIREMLDYLYEKNGQPVSDNARFVLSKAAKKLWLNDKPYNFKEKLYIITSDYLAGGGDKMTFLSDASNLWDSGVLMRDIYLEHVRRQKTIPYYPVQKRMEVIK